MPLRFLIRRTERFFIYRVLHVDDTPHRIALGVAVGIFVAWTPTIGFQMLLTLALAWLVRANKLVGLPFVWISNPLTFMPLYGTNFILGRWMLGGNYRAPDLAKTFSIGGSWWFEAWVNRIRAFWEATWHAFTPLWLGSFVVGLFLGIVTYIMVRYAVVAYRRARQMRRRHRELSEAKKS